MNEYKFTNLQDTVGPEQTLRFVRRVQIMERWIHIPGCVKMDQMVRSGEKLLISAIQMSALKVFPLEMIKITTQRE